MWARICATSRPWCSPRKRPSSASLSAGSLRRSRPLASWASTSGRTCRRRVPRACAAQTRPGFRGDAGELDARVLEHLVQALHLPASLLDLRLAVTGQVAQLADRPRRHEARPHQPMLDQLADPGRVGDVGLAAGHVAQMPRIQQPTLEALLEQIEDRLPVTAGRLHPDQRHPVTRQPVSERHQPARRRLERARLLQPLPTTAGHAHGRGHAVLMHIEPGTALDETIHRASSLPLDAEDAARRSLVTKNLGSALAAALSGAWKLPRHILRSGITAPIRHRRQPSGRTIFTHHGWRENAMAILRELRHAAVAASWFNLGLLMPPVDAAP